MSERPTSGSASESEGEGESEAEIEAEAEPEAESGGTPEARPTEGVGSDDASRDTDAPDEPLGELVRRLRRRDRGRDDPDDGAGLDVFDREEWDVADGDGADAGELFEERAIADVDADRVWESILDDESSTDEPGGPCPGTDAGPERTDARERSHTVPKREYCQSCVFFSEPPAVACTHDAGTIVEVVDSERFVVRGCPVVAGRVDTDGTVLAWDGPAGDGRVPSVAERTDRPGTDEQ